jgi:hypothetical protein
MSYEEACCKCGTQSYLKSDCGGGHFDYKGSRQVDLDGYRRAGNNDGWSEKGIFVFWIVGAFVMKALGAQNMEPGENGAGRGRS